MMNEDRKGYLVSQAAGRAALAAIENKEGRLALSQLRRVRQLGSGDVGLVDLVELQDGSQR